jgi:hypothetical protein
MSRKECIFAVLLLSVQVAAQSNPVYQVPTASQSIVQPPGTSAPTTFSTNNEAGIVYAVGSYNWLLSPTMPATLTGGQPNTVTLNPCPAGILVLAGVQPFTRIWLSGTTSSGGATEAVTVTATTCPLQGGSSGTVTFQPVNSYFSGYKLGSASQGIQEAINAANTISTNFPNQLGKVIIPPGDYTAKARVSILGNKQYIDANGAVLTCTMADTCVFVGDTGSANATWDVAIDGLLVRPGFIGGRFPAIEDNGQHTMLRNIATRDPSSSGPTFFTIVQIDDDQAAVIEKFDPSRTQGWAHCGTDWCSVAIYGPGPFGTNAGVIWVKDSNISGQCFFNGIDNQDANTLRVSDTIVQGYPQFGIRAVGSNTNVAATLDNVYMEDGCTGFNPLGVGAAGLISEGFTSVMHSTAPAGVLPQFGNGMTGQLYAYYVVVNSSTGFSAPYLAGWAYTSSIAPITVKWPQVGTTGTVTYDLLRQTVNNLGGTTPAPYGMGTSVQTGIRASTNCSNHICTFNDPVGTLSNYPITTPSTYAPALTFWPGSVILTEAADSGTTNGGEPRLYTDIVGPSTGISLGGFVNSYGANVPTVFAQQCSGLSTWSSIWISCPAGDSVSSNSPAIGALLLQSGPTGSNAATGLKGRLNFLTPSDLPATHLITLGDSNPAKTLATPGHRPTNDANDTWIGLDNANAAPSLFQLAFGAPKSISSYIGNIGDNTNFLERLTSTTKAFGNTIQIVSTLPTTPGFPPFSVASTVPVANLTAVPTTYNHSGTQQTNTHIVVDTVQLSSGSGTATVTFTGSAVFTSASTFACAATDNTNPDAVQVSKSSGSSIAFKGNPSDVVGYSCVGD